jgi:riboflavin biosynthesis pyrimidine reductase
MGGLKLFDKLERDRIYIITSKKPKNMSIKSRRFLKGVNIENIKSELGFLNIKEVLKIVSKMGVNRLMVEGGASVWTSFLKTGCFDEIVMFTGSKIINDSALSCFNDFLPPDTRLGDFPNLTLTSLQNWKDDIEARWEVRS